VIRNLLAAGLKVSWYATEAEDSVIVRVSAGFDRLSEQAESLAETHDTPFMVRSQVNLIHLNHI